MKKHISLIAFVSVMLIFIVIWCNGCKTSIIEIDPQIIQEKIYEPTAIQYKGLNQSTVLYVDHSTCVIDAVRHSQVYKALRPNLTQYCDTLRLIKGSNFESIHLDREKNKVAEILEKIQDDIPFTDIRAAIFQICRDDQQAILITDCESYWNGRFLDLEPYMSEPFRDWLEKGHAIYIITEPYRERYNGKYYDKKRFYFIFSNDYIQAPISHNMIGEVQDLIQDGVCTLYKMTNSDIFVLPPKDDFLDENLSIDNVEYRNGFEFITIYTPWKDIREYVMKLDKYGNPIPDENPVPLIKNLSFGDGENFVVGNIQIKATNITSRYCALEDSTIVARDIDISDGFMLDENAFNNQRLDVMLTDKIFTEGYLSDEFGGNLIRIDFVISEIGLKPRNFAEFEWPSMWSSEKAICVSKSIDNALRDAQVVPTCLNRRLLHTVFIQTK